MEVINLRFYTMGKFQNSEYIGGEETVIMNIDPDLFSYTVVMEHVKDDLGYTEIGGIYMKDRDRKSVV